jgi:hypothetical protein
VFAETRANDIEEAKEIIHHPVADVSMDSPNQPDANHGASTFEASETHSIILEGQRGLYGIIRPAVDNKPLFMCQEIAFTAIEEDIEGT